MFCETKIDDTLKMIAIIAIAIWAAEEGFKKGFKKGKEAAL